MKKKLKPLTKEQKEIGSLSDKLRQAEAMVRYLESELEGCKREFETLKERFQSADKAVWNLVGKIRDVHMIAKEEGLANKNVAKIEGFTMAVLGSHTFDNIGSTVNGAAVLRKKEQGV